MTAARARSRPLLLLSLVLAAGCGGHAADPATKANTALLDRVPVYPGAHAPKTSPGATFSARDWTLPRTAAARTVVDWYVARLQAGGWKVGGRSFDTIRATRGPASLSVGVRARTLEVVANSEGG